MHQHAVYIMLYKPRPQNTHDISRTVPLLWHQLTSILKVCRLKSWFSEDYNSWVWFTLAKIKVKNLITALNYEVKVRANLVTTCCLTWPSEGFVWILNVKGTHTRQWTLVMQQRAKQKNTPCNYPPKIKITTKLNDDSTSWKWGFDWADTAEMFLSLYNVSQTIGITLAL